MSHTRRQMKRLAELGKKVGGRTDKTLLLSAVEPALAVAASRGLPTRFFDKLEPGRLEVSELAYDFNMLLEEDFIRVAYVPEDLGEQYVPALLVTKEGHRAIAEWRKSWLSKAIDKQPITFLQVVITIALTMVSGTAGWMLRGQVATSRPQDAGQEKPFDGNSNTPMSTKSQIDSSIEEKST